MKQFSIFLIIGGSSAVINFASFFIFFHFIQLHYQQAVTISYLLSVIAHFFGNRFFTFKAHQQSLQKQLPRYLILTLINYAITLTIITLAVQYARLSPYLGLVLSIASTVGIGFFVAKHWVFSAFQMKSDVNC